MVKTSDPESAYQTVPCTWFVDVMVHWAWTIVPKKVKHTIYDLIAIPTYAMTIQGLSCYSLSHSTLR